MNPRTLTRILTILTVAVLALAPLGAAQSLSSLLPAETMVALGTTGLSEHADLFEDFLTEFEVRGVGNALAELFGDINDETAEMDAEVPAALQDLGPLDVIGRDAWLAVSASAFNPFPVVTLVARMSDDATNAFGRIIAENETGDAVQKLTEGTVPFWVMLLEEPDSPFQVLAYTQWDGVTMISTNPDVLRGVLRRMADRAEPAFTTTPSYDVTLGQLGDGQFFGFMDLGTVAAAIAPFTRGLGFGPQIERLQRALTTAGTSGGVVRVVPEGVETMSIMVPNPNGGDEALYDLLTAGGSYDPASMRFVPRSALTATTNRTDMAGWWNYLNALVGSIPEIGIQSLDQALMDFLGIDLDATLFSWTGDHVAMITTGTTEVAQPGMTAENLLGEQVYAIAATDEAAAREGLSDLIGNVTLMVSAFADPTGGAGGAETAQRTVAGVTVDTYRITTGIEISSAVTNGYALISTSSAAMDEVLEAAASDAGLSQVFDRLLEDVPEDATGLSLTDSRAAMEASALQLASLIQLGSGFGGASNLDFDAVTRASETVEGYLLFVASRLGGSVSHSRVEVDRTVSKGRTAVTW